MDFCGRICACPNNDDLLLLLTTEENISDGPVGDLPPPCHHLPVGSCPDNISATLDLIKCVVELGVPNRDGERCPVGVLLPGRPDYRTTVTRRMCWRGQNGWELGTLDYPFPLYL